MARRQTKKEGAARAVMTGSGTFKILDWGTNRDAGVYFVGPEDLSDDDMAIVRGDSSPRGEGPSPGRAAAEEAERQRVAAESQRRQAAAAAARQQQQAARQQAAPAAPAQATVEQPPVLQPPPKEKKTPTGPDTQGQGTGIGTDYLPDPPEGYKWGPGRKLVPDTGPVGGDTAITEQVYDTPVPTAGDGPAATQGKYPPGWSYWDLAAQHTPIGGESVKPVPPKAAAKSGIASTAQANAAAAAAKEAEAEVQNMATSGYFSRIVTPYMATNPSKDQLDYVQSDVQMLKAQNQQILEQQAAQAEYTESVLEGITPLSFAQGVAASTGVPQIVGALTSQGADTPPTEALAGTYPSSGAGEIPVTPGMVPSYEMAEAIITPMHQAAMGAGEQFKDTFQTAMAQDIARAEQAGQAYVDEYGVGSGPGELVMEQTPPGPGGLGMNILATIGSAVLAEGVQGVLGYEADPTHGLPQAHDWARQSAATQVPPAPGSYPPHDASIQGPWAGGPSEFGGGGGGGPGTGGGGFGGPGEDTVAMTTGSFVEEGPGIAGGGGGGFGSAPPIGGYDYPPVTYGDAQDYYAMMGVPYPGPILPDTPSALSEVAALPRATPGAVPFVSPGQGPSATAGGNLGTSGAGGGGFLQPLQMMGPYGGMMNYP
jgi:hypothetical protein